MTDWPTNRRSPGKFNQQRGSYKTAVSRFEEFKLLPVENLTIIWKTARLVHVLPPTLQTCLAAISL